MTKLESWISQEESDELALLNLAHTTYWEELENICRTKKIRVDGAFFPHPDAKRTFASTAVPTNLVYLFYGLPNFKPMDAEVSMTDIGYKPIGLLFKPNVINEASKCYPFDTGAYFLGMYDSIHKGFKTTDIENFEVKLNGAAESTLRKLVKRYFCTNENYCEGRSCFSLSSLASSTEELIYKLHNYNQPNRLDERVSSIEVHYPKDLEIEGNLEAIIVPDKSYKLFMKKMLFDLSTICEVITYRDSVRYTPSICCGLIKEKAYQYYLDTNKLAN